MGAATPPAGGAQGAPPPAASRTRPPPPPPPPRPPCAPSSPPPPRPSTRTGRVPHSPALVSGGQRLSVGQVLWVRVRGMLPAAGAGVGAETWLRALTQRP